MKRMIGISLVVAGLTALSASAQQSGFSVGAATTSSVGGAAGMSLDLAYSTRIKSADLPVRFSLGYYALGGSTETDNAKLSTTQFAADIFAAKGEKLALFVGVSGNHWRTLDGPVGSGEIQGIKMGLRLGAEYAIDKNLSASVTYQITEAGLDTSLSGNKVGSGSRGLNPSWIQVGFRYHF